MRHYFGDLSKEHNLDLTSKRMLRIKAHTPGTSSYPLQVALVMKDGSAFGGIIQLDSVKHEHTLLLRDLKPVKAVLLPRPYPTFLPYYSTAGNAVALDMKEVESLQISIGPGLHLPQWGRTYELMLSSVTLE
jgi:hypothetical protein